MPNITLAAMQSLVLDRLDGNSLLYPSSEITLYINEAIRTFNILTGALQTSTPLVAGPTWADRVWYDIPSPILIPLKIQVENLFLRKYSTTKLGQNYPNWLQETTASVGYPVSHWTPVGITKFGIHPADAVGGLDILVTGIIEPTPLVNPGDVIPFSNEDSNAIEDLTVFSLQLKEGGPLFKTAQGLYQRFISEMKQRIRWRNCSMPAFQSEAKVRR